MSPVHRQPTLHGPKFKLRPLEPADREEFVAVASDPLIWEEHPEPDRASAERPRANMITPET